VSELLLSSDLLGCTSLSDLCYAKLAIFFRSKYLPFNNFIATPTSELKKTFLLAETDFTPNQIEDIKKGNDWLMTLTEDRIKELDNV
jgi:hypothetical protein